MQIGWNNHMVHVIAYKIVRTYIEGMGQISQYSCVMDNRHKARYPLEELVHIYTAKDRATPCLSGELEMHWYLFNEVLLHKVQEQSAKTSKSSGNTD